MKKIAIAFLALLLALTFMLSGCASHGATLITAGKNEISVNVYQLYLSRMKWSLYASGENVNSAQYWKQILSLSGKTYKEHYSTQVLEGLKQIAAALYLYDELGLSLSKEDEAAIDELIDAFIEDRDMGNGSKTKLNSILSEYGANVTVLRDSYVIEAKLAQLKAHLYGKDGANLTAPVFEEYYKQSYIRGFQLSVANYYYQHELDIDKNSKYYKTKTADDGTVTLTEEVAYDTVKGVAVEEKDENGNTVTVYRLQNEDGSFGAIAYDKRNGAVKYVYDENGDYIELLYSDAEMEKRYENLQKIAEDCKNDPALFLEYAQYSDSSAFNDAYAPNGMYFSMGTSMGDDLFDSFFAELVTLQEGQISGVEFTSQGKTHYYLLMRAPLDDGAWAEEANERWFQTLVNDTMEYMLQKECEDYMQYVTVDESVLDGVDITMVSANRYY